MTTSLTPPPVLDVQRLEQMINTALAQPQLAPIPTPAGFGARLAEWLQNLTGEALRPVQAVAVTACLLALVVAVTLGTPVPVGHAPGNNDDALTEVSDLIALDVLESMS